MNNKETFKINCTYFRLCHVLSGTNKQQEPRKLRIWVSIIIAIISSILIVGLGYISADYETVNFFEKGFYAICPIFFSIFSDTQYSVAQGFHALAFLYIVATVFFFITNLFCLEVSYQFGFRILKNLSKIYSRNQRTSFLTGIRDELAEFKHCPHLIIIVAVIFLLGEIIVMWRQSVLTNQAEHWSDIYRAYLLLVPIPLNALLVGTQAALIISIVRIIYKIMPDLPAKLFDDDGYAGLSPAGTYICLISLLWLISMILLTPLFLLSREAGALMFLLLAIIGMAMFILPLYGFHKKLLARKRKVMAYYADMLNGAINNYRKNPDQNKIEHINMLRDCYKRAEELNVWVLFSMQSISMQIVSVLWATYNTVSELYEQYKELVFNDIRILYF